MFSPINLEADVHLIDLDSETVPPASQPVTLVIRQGIEILVKSPDGTTPAAVVFIELKEGQIQASVWDIFNNCLTDEPVVHLLKEVAAKEQSA